MIVIKINKWQKDVVELTHVAQPALCLHPKEIRKMLQDSPGEASQKALSARTPSALHHDDTPAKDDIEESGMNMEGFCCPYQ